MSETYWLVLADDGTEDGAAKWVGLALSGSDARHRSGFEDDAIFQVSPAVDKANEATR